MIQLVWHPFQVHLPSFLIWFRDQFPEKADGLVAEEDILKVIFLSPPTSEEEQQVIDHWNSLTEEGENLKINPPVDALTQKKLQILGNWQIGQGIISEYYAQFKLDGLTVTQIRETSNKLDSFEKLLLFGLFEEALNEIDSVTLDSIITQTWVDSIKAKIQEHI